ncbi:MAG: segregation/condensation protein A [Gammaproteobacteria bacterium]|nr:segregation/condensation protein A [Gammaproteobacteria bacterium]
MISYSAMSQDPPTEVTPTRPEQQEMPFALVHGKVMSEPPRDLYIPPDALEVFLEAFEGPLDLLLYLIRRHNLEILDIPIAEITRQYMQYIELMHEMRFELAAEYLLMAAMLAEIKSRMLLPRPVEAEDEADPRAELVRRLQEYERFKQAAADLDALPRVDREVFPVAVEAPEAKVVKLPPRVELRDILLTFQEVMARAEMFSHHQIVLEPLSVRERMTIILENVNAEQFVEFASLFTPEEGRRGVVVSLLAILELIRESLLELIQTEAFGPIYVKAPQHVNESAAH